VRLGKCSVVQRSTIRKGLVVDYRDLEDHIRSTLVWFSQGLEKVWVALWLCCLLNREYLHS